MSNANKTTREVIEVGPMEIHPEDHLARAGRFIHTHFGFGYRFAADQDGTLTTGSQAVNNVGAARPDTLLQAS